MMVDTLAGTTAKESLAACKPRHFEVTGSSEHSGAIIGQYVTITVGATAYSGFEPSDLDELRTERAELHDLLAAMAVGLELDRPTALNEIASRAVFNMASRKQEDVASWADRLARDVADAGD